MRPEAVEAMLPYLTERFGNPSGSHAVAREARKALDEARDVVAECLGAEPGEVVFTGSGTEADNLAILGAHAVRGGRVVCTAIEHHAMLHGGGQERDRRSGTHNVAGIVGMAAAMRATVATRADTVARVASLRDRLADGLLAAIPDAAETGDRSSKVAGNCHLSFAGVESEALLVLLDGAGVCASAGSACTSGAVEPSHVLTAMGVAPPLAMGSLRLSLGVATTDADIDLALATVPEAVARLRS